MTLAPGTRLGPFEIVAPLGAGGMGEVHRARDTRLGRDVAIKALPEAFARDPDRLSRFEREAKLLASLSHANVAGIHGLEMVEGQRYLVLEFVEGETLAARLARGPLPAAEAADVCRQIAAGVESAHDAGVVHRDLKPGNVMLKPDGTVKVLDFGLAKGGAAHGASGSDPNLSASPTMTYAKTTEGVILGTAAYMSPEQARGRSVDRRTDVWSFGCVLYECLSGRRVFDGETVSDMVARILEREPDWSALPAATPPWLRGLLKRCLTKDLKQRLQAIGEARIALERADEGHAKSSASPPARRAGLPGWIPWTLAATFAAVGVGPFVLPGLRAPATPVRHVELGFPPGQLRAPHSYPVISPDARHVAIVASDSTGVSRVWVRSLGEFEFRLLDGTQGAVFLFWSPDSRSLGFASGGSLSRVSIEDGSVQKLGATVTTQRGGSWGENGTILYTPGTNAGIWRVPATGGAALQVTHVDTNLVDASHRFPVWLPDGKHFLFALWSNNPRVLAETGGIYLASVEGGAPRRICADLGSFVFVRSGYLLVKRGTALVAIPFDARSFRVGTRVIPVADPVGFLANAGFVFASASANGDIAFATEADLPLTDIVWLDRSGHRGDAIGLRTEFSTIRLAPDDAHVVAEMDDATGLTQLWTGDLARRTVSRLTRDANDSYAPAWSGDGESIAFTNRDTGTEDLYVQLAAGTRPKRRLWSAREADTYVTDWSTDGRWLLFDGHPRSGPARGQVWVADRTSDSVHVLLAGDFDQGGARLSPDGRWLAYVSNESGRSEVYVRSFPDLERRWQVSTAGGEAPHWSRNGRELVFWNAPGGDRAVLAVSITPSATGLSLGEPRQLFGLPQDVIGLDPGSDHTRFLALVQPTARVEPALRVILGWKPGQQK